MIFCTNVRIKKLMRTKCFKFALYFGLLWYIYRVLSSTKDEKLPPVNVNYVVVHLDLKGTPLKLQYLKSLLPTLKKYGVNGLLMEYEDMFPFEEGLVNLSNKNCYNKEQLLDFLYEANDSGFEIIPLVQTFGHMQYALKLNEFAHLREDPNHSDSICPSKDESLTLIKNMIQQVIKFHNSITPLKHIHIGCDEVYHMNKCNDCVKRNISKQMIYLNHLTKVTAFVKKLSQKTKILVWDDMLRTISPINWKYEYKLPIEPVYWQYAPSFNISNSSLLKYHKTFSDIWIATAYKGADGNSSLIPNAKNRFLNHYTWLKYLCNYKFGGEKTTYNFKGIILTGWSRYTHFEPSCDLMPASIPSLILNLLLIKEFKAGNISYNVQSAPDKLYKYFEMKLKYALHCESDDKMPKEIDNLDHLDLTLCDFKGFTLYENLKMYEQLNLSIVIDANMRNLRENRHVRQECDDNSMSIKFLENDFAYNMREFYEEDFINEFVFDKMLKLKARLIYCLDLRDN